MIKYYVEEKSLGIVYFLKSIFKREYFLKLMGNEC